MHPVLFQLFGEPVYAYAITTVLGYALGVGLGIWAGRIDGRPWLDLIEMGVVVVLAALLGSKVFHVLFEAEGHHLSDGSTARGVVDLLRDDPWHWARLFEAGYVFYGGAVFGSVLGWLFAVRRNFDERLGFGDYAVPGFALGIGVGRIGCYLAGCCYGRATDVAWAVQFPDDHPSHGALVHPVQLYDAAFGFLAFAVAMLLYRRRRFRGEIFLGFAFSYGLWRFVTETFRADADRGVWFGGHLSTSQLVSLAVLPVVAFVWWHTLRAVKQGKRKSAREPLEVA